MTVLSQLENIQSLTGNMDNANNRHKWQNIKVILDCQQENGKHLSHGPKLRKRLIN